MKVGSVLFIQCFLVGLIFFGSSCNPEVDPAEKNVFSKVYGSGKITIGVDILPYDEGYRLLGYEAIPGDSTRIYIYDCNKQGIQKSAPLQFDFRGISIPVKLAQLQGTNQLFIMGNTRPNTIVNRNTFLMQVNANGQALFQVDSAKTAFDEDLKDFIFYQGRIISTGNTTEMQSVSAPAHRDAFVKYYNLSTGEWQHQVYGSSGYDSGERLFLQPAYNTFILVSSYQQLPNPTTPENANHSRNIKMYVFDSNGDVIDGNYVFGTSNDQNITGAYYDEAANNLFVYGSQTVSNQNQLFIYKSKGQTSPILDNRSFNVADGFPRVYTNTENNIPLDLIELQNNDLLLIGTVTTLIRGSDLFLWKMQANGQPVWNTWLPRGGRQDEVVNKVYLEEDGTVLILSTLTLNPNSRVMQLSRINVM